MHLFCKEDDNFDLRFEPLVQDCQDFNPIWLENKDCDEHIIDPGLNAHFVDQVAADKRIQDTFITPFDKSNYIQVIKNPKTRANS